MNGLVTDELIPEDEHITYMIFGFKGYHENPSNLQIEMYKSGGSNNILLVDGLGIDEAGVKIFGTTSKYVLF